MWKAIVTAGVFALAAAGPAAAEDPSLHGFMNLAVKNDYITPRGLHVTSKGTTVQLLNGLVVDFPQDPGGTITDASVFGTTWIDFNPGYGKPNTSALNEVDWSVGANITIKKDWKLGAEYVQFISGQNAFDTEKNIEFSLAFDDSPYMKPVAFHPYVKLFYAISGDSTVVTGKRGHTYDVEFGASPSIDLHPVTLSAPTWITVGPEDFWGGGGNAGVFSTGLKASVPITAIPASAGHWSAFAGYQYYHLINDRLVLAQAILNQGKTSRNVHLWQFGVGMGF